MLPAHSPAARRRAALAAVAAEAGLLAAALALLPQANPHAPGPLAPVALAVWLTQSPGWCLAALLLLPFGADASGPAFAALVGLGNLPGCYAAARLWQTRRAAP